MAKDVIIALDFPGAEEAFQLLKLFEEPVYVKVGMELFYKEGPEIVRKIKSMGHKIFLDLKLHDIPNTVAKATASLLALDVDMINYHAGGGMEMLRAAQEVVNQSGKDVITLAVTVLTSTDERTMKEEVHLAFDTVEEAVLAYAKATKAAGMSGIVCSAMESAMIEKELGEECLTVTPGIRPAGSSADDQKRIVTPEMARQFGADYIVVGRPITKAQDPYSAYQNIKTAFLGGNR